MWMRAPEDTAFVLASASPFGGVRSGYPRAGVTLMAAITELLK